MNLVEVETEYPPLINSTTTTVFPTGVHTFVELSKWNPFCLPSWVGPSPLSINRPRFLQSRPGNQTCMPRDVHDLHENSGLPPPSREKQTRWVYDSPRSFCSLHLCFPRTVWFSYLSFYDFTLSRTRWGVRTNDFLLRETLYPLVVWTEKLQILLVIRLSSWLPLQISSVDVDVIFLTLSSAQCPNSDLPQTLHPSELQ